MTKSLLSLLAAAVVLGSGCEQHPASQTVPGFKEKNAQNQAAQDQKARTPVAIDPDAPRFFPSKAETH
jgi:hypothetical protein